MKRKLLVTLVVLAVVTVTVAAYYRANRAPAAPAVVTAAVTRGSVVDSVDATGTIEAVTTVQVGTQVSGTIAWLGADFNSVVHRNDVIARLDPSLFQAQLEQARATLVRLQADEARARVQLTDAQQKLARARTLAEKKLLADADFDAAKVAVDAAQAALNSAAAQIVQSRAALNQAQVNLDHTIIRAPIDGIVIQRSVDVGQTVAASMQAPTLFILAQDLTQMQVKASIDESDIGQIRPGQHVRFRVDAYQGEEFGGTVSQIRLQPVVQQNVVSYQTIVSVPNAQLKLKPGMTANVTIEIARQDHALRLPAAALRFRPTAQMFAALGQAPPPGLAGARVADGSTAGGGAGPQANGAGSQPGGDDALASGTGRRPGGDGGGGGAGGGRGGAMTDDTRVARRQSFTQRLAQMSPEERQQVEARRAQRNGGGSPRNAGGQPPVPSTLAKPGANWRQASTIDAMFGPVSVPERSARVWIAVEGRIKPVSIRVGLSDATNTVMVDGPLQEGAEVVTGVSLPTTTSASSANPLLPSFGRMRGPGGGGPRGR